MKISYKDYFSNLSSYEEFVIKTTLLGKDISDKRILKSFNIVNDYFWFPTTNGFVFLDKHGRKVENIKKLKGSFDCSRTNITSLEGTPREIGGNFDCSNTSITSLEGAPQKVGGGFYCSHTKVPQEEIEAYNEFLKNPTPEHIDETGHYKP